MKHSSTSSLFSNFGSLETLPSDFHPIVEIQRLLFELTEENIEDTYKQIIDLNSKLDNYDDLATSLCDISWRMSKKNRLYVDLTVKLCMFGMDFMQSLLEVIRPCNGLFFRGLFKKEIFTKEHVRVKIENERRMHYFFIPELNSKNQINETKKQDNDIEFIKKFSKLVAMQPNEVKEASDYGYKKKSIEFLLKYDESKFFKQILKKHPKKAKNLLELNPFEMFQDKLAPIDFAAYYGSSKCFDLLLKEGEQITKTTCTCALHGCNSYIIDTCREKLGDFSQGLRVAVDMQLSAMYKPILEMMNFDDVMCTNFDQILASKNYPIIWSFFLLGFDASVLKNGNSLLHVAIITRQYTFAKLLMHDLPSINQENGKGLTPLSIAASYGYRNLCKLLLENGASANVKWNKYDTLLSTALLYNDMNSVNFLIEHGAVVDSRLFLSASTNEKIAHTLIKLSPPIAFKGLKGNNPLHEAGMGDDILNLQTLLDNQRYNIDAQNELGFTPFHIALYSDYPTNAAIFISRNCNVNTHNYIGETPIMCASRIGLFDYASLMIEMGAEVNYKTVGGLTALHIASLESRQDICALLIMNGANTDAADCFGKKPVDYASTPSVKILFN